MSTTHSSNNLSLPVNCQGVPLELVQTTKLFAVHIDEHMRWNEHITKTLASCSRDLKHLAPYHVSKQLAESVVDGKCPNLSLWLCL